MLEALADCSQAVLRSPAVTVLVFGWIQIQPDVINLRRSLNTSFRSIVNPGTQPPNTEVVAICQVEMDSRYRSCTNGSDTARERGLPSEGT